MTGSVAVVITVTVDVTPLLEVLVTLVLPPVLPGLGVDVLVWFEPLGGIDVGLKTPVVAVNDIFVPLPLSG